MAWMFMERVLFILLEGIQVVMNSRIVPVSFILHKCILIMIHLCFCNGELNRRVLSDDHRRFFPGRFCALTLHAAAQRKLPTYFACQMIQ